MTKVKFKIKRKTKIHIEKDVHICIYLLWSGKLVYFGKVFMEFVSTLRYSKYIDNILKFMCSRLKDA